MTAKILTVFLCAAIGTATGAVIRRSFSRNAEYFAAVCDMIGELKRNISYRRDSAASILLSYESSSAHLKSNIAEYIEFSRRKEGELVISRGFLPNAAYAKVKGLFGSLGSSDGGTQLRELEMFESEFNKLKDDADKKCEKYGALSVKLGFLFGLGVGVLFI